MVSDPRPFYLIPPPVTLYTDTGATSPSPTPKIRVPSGEQLVPLLTTLVCRGPGSNRVPPDLGADTLPTELPSIHSRVYALILINRFTIEIF